MQIACPPVDASQLLRDILQSKDKFHDNNNTTTTNSSNNHHHLQQEQASPVKDLYPTPQHPATPNGCNGEMISPLLQSKSSDMAYHDRDRDGNEDVDNDEDNELDVTVEDNDNDTSTIENNDDDNNMDEADDSSVLEERGKSDESGKSPMSGGAESKEARRAHVENILTSMRQSPNQPNNDTMDSSFGSSTPDVKRQKRKQPQPQQHEDLALHRQLQHLQEQMQAAKKMKREDVDDSTVDDDVTVLESNELSDDDDDDIRKAGGSKPVSPVENGFDYTNGVSPGSDLGKRQKRKQPQPQQHDNSRTNHHINNFLLTPPRSKYDNTDDNEGNDSVSESSTFPGAAEAMFRNNWYRSLAEKEFMPPFHNGFDPHLYRENLFRHGLFGLRPDLDPMAALRNVTKTFQARAEAAQVEGQGKLPTQAELSKIANALKAELVQAMNKAIDNAVSKVLSEKQANAESSSDTQQQQQQQHHQNHQHEQQKQQQQQQQQQQQAERHHQSPHPTKHHQQQHSPIIPPQFPHHLHHLQQQHHQQQQQQQQREREQQQQREREQHHQSQSVPPSFPQHPVPTSQGQEREALKETVNNSQAEKKPELIVPFSDHLHFLERFGSRLQQHPDKLSAFEPLHKPESDLITPHTGPTMPFPPHFPYYLPTQVLPPIYTAGEPEQTEALPLIVNTQKKKRTKVTDTRLSSPRGPSITSGKGLLLQDNTPSSSMDAAVAHHEAQRHLAAAFPHFLPPVLPTSVAITNPSLTHSDLVALRMREAASFVDSRIPSPQDHMSRGSPRSPSDSSPFLNKMDMYDRVGMGFTPDLMDQGTPGGGHMTSTLTPMHLRKAKLMFFYTRYPSSSILKMYFPDVMFNKNNTAQLVKWFSNFREFFYIQMEKYARQALVEGIKHAEDLVVTTDSELFRHLNLHYNRNNQLEVPQNFMQAVQAALKEFFKAIQTGKDLEPSWKKAIYKIIARMDETLPDFFKSPNWMEQLGDQ